MKLIMPKYCKDFKCIAQKCRDNCCTEWEIYIDDISLKKYENAIGDFGKRLKDGIDFKNKCFKMKEDGSCRFLNKENLCDIYINCGEESLCNICTRHPRYFEWFGDTIEGGIGLCCEEAARIILSSKKFEINEEPAPKSLCRDENNDLSIDYYKFLQEAREKIFFLLENNNIRLSKKLEIICAYAKDLQDLTEYYKIDCAPEFEYMEKFDTAFALKIMQKADFFENSDKQYFKNLLSWFESEKGTDDIFAENELCRIAEYFVWRYFMKGVFSGNIYPRLMFSVFAVKVINAVYNFEMQTSGKLDFDKKCLIAKDFSKTIEYSEENLDLVYNSLTY